MGIVKNQHYVPRFYLENFLNADENLFAFDKPTERQFPAAVDKVANENYFYDIEDLDKVTGIKQFLEKYFHPLENEISRLLPELLDDLKSNSFKTISEEVKSKFSLYLTYQYLRTREQRELMSQMLDTVSNALANIQLGHLDKSDSEFEIEADEAKFQAAMILDRENVEDLANVLKNHLWLILENVESKPFYTSDHPFVKRGHVKKPGMSMNGIASPGIEIAFPISPTYMLLLLDREVFPNYIDHENQIIQTEDEENVTYYNSLQVQQSYRQVYSSTGEFELVKRMIKENPNVSSLKRIRFTSNWDNRG